MPYPPIIKQSDFQAADAPSTAERLQCEKNSCSLNEISLLPVSQEGFFGAGDTHDPLEPGAPGRYCLAPGREGKLQLHWSLEGHEHVASLKLAIYTRSAQASSPLWTRTVEKPDAMGRVPFSGELSRGAQERWTDVSSASGEDFPSAHLNLERAPYKLLVSIVATEGAYAVKSHAWIYLDVVPRKIRLRRDDQAKLPPHSHTLEILPLPLSHDVVGRVLLPSNLFSIDTDEWHGDSKDCPFERYEDAWQDGPEIALLAQLCVQRSDGKPVFASEAVAGSTLLWEARDAKPPHGARGFENEDKRTAAFINVHEVNDTIDGRNCHVLHGGKRGSARAEDHLFPAGTDQAQQYGVRAAERRQCALSPSGKSGSGVVFRPSRMAGDSYRLAAYWHCDPEGKGNGYKDLDHDGELEPDCVRTSGTFQIWRKVDIVKYVTSTVTPDSQLRMEPQEARVYWLKQLSIICERYDEAYICFNELDAGPPQCIANYHLKVGKLVSGMSPVIQAAVRLDAESWQRGHYGVHFYEFAAFRERMAGDWEELQNYFGANSKIDESQPRYQEPIKLDDEKEMREIYDKSCYGWAKKIIFDLLKTELTTDKGITIYDFAGVWRRSSLDEEPEVADSAQLLGVAPLFDDDRTAFINFGTESAYRAVTKKASARFDQTMGSTGAHEIGHCFYLCHAKDAEGAGGRGIEPTYHDSTLLTCLMGYHANAQYFCGMCLLRLRGWRRTTLQHNVITRSTAAGVTATAGAPLTTYTKSKTTARRQIKLVRWNGDWRVKAPALGARISLVSGEYSAQGTTDGSGIVTFDFTLSDSYATYRLVIDHQQQQIVDEGTVTMESDDEKQFYVETPVLAFTAPNGPFAKNTGQQHNCTLSIGQGVPGNTNVELQLAQGDLDGCVVTQADGQVVQLVATESDGGWFSEAGPPAATVTVDDLPLAIVLTSGDGLYELTAKILNAPTATLTVRFA